MVPASSSSPADDDAISDASELDAADTIVAPLPPISRRPTPSGRAAIVNNTTHVDAAQLQKTLKEALRVAAEQRRRNQCAPPPPPPPLPLSSTSTSSPPPSLTRQTSSRPSSASNVANSGGAKQRHSRTPTYQQQPQNQPRHTPIDSPHAAAASLDWLLPLLIQGTRRQSAKYARARERVPTNTSKI